MGKLITKNGKTKTTTTSDGLKTLINRRYTAVRFEVPGFDGELVVEVSPLKRREREGIIEQVNKPGGWDNLLQNRLAVAYGLVEPKLVDLPYDDPNDPQVHERYVQETTEALLEYPDFFIEPIASRIWELSDVEDRKKGGPKSSPFTKTSGSPSGSLTEPASIPTP